MAVELTAVALQNVLAGQNVLFTDTAVRCNRGYVVHREGAGIVTLRGITSNNFARYRVAFYGNIGLPTGGTAAPISIALSINGEAVPATAATITVPAGSVGNVSTSFIVDVPRGCCYTIAVKNVTDPPGPIDVANANLIIERIA
ncbi:MAG: hypothetical protein MJ135_06950 [Oscillospiraceae bacterium]|nr:hypothetical protein [Oscillospiraceae bacterium]